MVQPVQVQPTFQPVQIQPTFQTPINQPAVNIHTPGVSPDVATNNELAKKVDELTATVAKLTQTLNTQVSNLQNDFKQLVQNLSAQVNQTNKTDVAILNSFRLVLASLHHMYATNPATAALPASNNLKIGTLPEFEAAMAKYAGIQNPQ